MARFEHILLVCTNEREDSDPRGSCTARGSPGVRARLKELVGEHGLKGKVRVTSCGCLELCAVGPNVLVLSAGAPARETWYSGVGVEDADELFETHVLRGERLDRRVKPLD